MARFAPAFLCGAIVALLYPASVGHGLQPGAGGSNPPAISAISERVRPSVENKEVAGAVTLVATPGRIAHLDATGKADIAADKPMQSDTIFWIASMTKPVTATAVLMLQDEGKLSVDDPVEKHLPEFKGLKTADGKLARVTIRQLLTHTSGMGEISANEARAIKDLTGVIPLYVAKSVQFEPGSKWAYCQSGINTAARIVEVASGEAFDRFVERRLFAPLGMKDTTFYLTEAQLPRLATSYRRTEKGELEASANPILYGKAPTSRDRFPAANGGLFSTATDYARFCQMILNDGEFQGRRYIKPESVRLMTGVQAGDLKTGFTPGNGWGLGWCVIREPQGVTAMLSPGTFGHGGAFGTQAWIDPGKKRAYILMVQRAGHPNSDASEIRRVFQESANAALAEETPFKLNLRSRGKDQGKPLVVETTASWEPRKMAIIVCDMWDDHWCRSAARRVSEMAGALNQALKTARDRGAFIIHAPSTTTGFYKDTPQRLRAQKAPYSSTPIPLSTSPRWGTAWYWPDAKREGVLPIDDSDMGCDCKVKCEINSPWTRQTAAIEISEADAITDDGQEVWNLLTSRGIDNVVLCGVHLNMCVLGRPFAIRQMTVLGKKVALMRDLTDTMYNPDRPPGISHFAGTDLMIEHVERYWCPTFISTDITGKAAFKFRGDAPAPD
jgi:CubicO group peptidase (beta-lactamase class C family)/nicotinamidase-related amidase